MAAEDILGISAQMDISDIQQSIDNLGKLLDEISEKTTKTGKEIESSLVSLDLSKIQQQIKATEDAIQSILSIVKANTQEINDFQTKIESAKEAINQGGNTSELNAQIKEYEQIIKDIQQNSKELIAEHDQLQGSLTSLVSKYNMVAQAASASQTASTTSVHDGAAAAIGAEATAHEKNAKEIENESTSVEKGIQSFKDYEEEINSVKQRISELQQKIIETKEDIQNAKNDVKDFEAQKEASAAKYGSQSSPVKNIDAAMNLSKQEVEEQTRALQNQQIELQRLKLQLSDLKDEQKSQADATKGQSDEFSTIIAKIEKWKSSFSDIEGMTQKFEGQNQAISAVKASIDELSASAANYSEQAKSLKEDIDTMSLNTRIDQRNGTGDSASDIDAIKQKISEYGEAVSYASGQAKAAYELQKEAVAALDNQLSQLKEQLQAAQATNNTDAVEKISSQIDVLSGTLSEAKVKLEELKSQSESASEALNNLSDVQSKLNENTEATGGIIGRLKDAFSALKNDVSETLEPLSGFSSKLSQVKDKVVDFATGGGKFQESLGNIKTAITGLPIPIESVTKGIGGMAKALWAMCSTPIGAVLAAITIGLQAVYKWFTKSAEGQRAFTKLSAYFGSIMSSITDIIVIFGKYLYHAFADNKAPMNSFAKSFVKTFKTAVSAAISLVSGLGTTLKGIFTLDWDTFTDGLSKTWDGLKKAGTAAIEAVGTSIKGTVGALKTVYSMFTDDKLGKELGASLNGMLSKASSAAKIAEQELDTNIQLGKEKEKQAKLDKQIAENREKIYTLTGKAKDAMIEETKALMKQKYDGQIKAQQQLYEIQKKRNQMHTSSLADIKKERDLHIDILSTQAQQMASTRMLTRMQEANRRSMENAEKQKNKKAASDAKKDQNQQNAISSAEGKLANVLYNNAYARVKAEKELEDAVTDAKIKAMKDGEEKVIAQRKRELEKEIEQIEEKKNATIKAERDRQKAEFDAQQSVIKAKGGKTEQWDDKKHLDEEPIKRITKQYDILEQKAVENSNKEIYAAQLQSLYDYLKEYGTIQEQRYAIAKEYDDKILKATDENQKKILQKQKESALAQNDAKNLAMGIDWGASFTGIGTVLKDLAKETLDKVEEYMRSSEFKKLGASDKKSYTDLRNSLRQETDTGFSPFNLSRWNDVAKDVKAYQDSVKEVKRISAIHSQAIKNYEKAQDELKNATTDKARELAQIKVEIAEKVVKSTGQQQLQAENEMEDAHGKLTDSTKDAAEGLQKFQEILGNITSGSLTNFAKGVGQLVNSIAGKSTKVGEALQGLGGKIGGLVGAILSIIEALGDDPAGFIEDLLNKITKVIENILSQLPQLVLSVVKGIGNVIGGIVRGLGNLLTGGIAFGSNVSKMEAEIAELTASNKELASAIDDLKEAISNDDNTNEKSVEAYKNAVKAQKEWNENQRKAISDRASEWSNSGHGFLGLGGRSSFNSYANKSKGSWLDSFNETLKQYGSSSRIYSAQDVWNLSNEEMKTLRDFSPKAWADFFNAGSGGQANPKDLVEEYIEKSGLEEELTDALNKKLTGYDWSGFKSSYASLIKDLKSETTDFADFINETLSNAIINSFMNEDVTQSRLKKIQKMVSDAAADGKISKNEVDDIRKANEDFANYVLNWRKQMIDAGLLKESSSQSEQTATGKGIEAITADQGSSLIGIGYAVQIALEQGNEVRKAISIDITALRGYTETISNNISEMRDIQYQGLEQLQAINRNTAPISLIREDIASMYKLMKERY